MLAFTLPFTLPFTLASILMKAMDKIEYAMAA